MTFDQELLLLLKARYPIIYIKTIEEDRVELLIRRNVKINLNRSIYTWDYVDGYTNNPNSEKFARRNPLQALEFIEDLNAETPAVFLLKDFNKFLTDLSVARKLKNLTRFLKLQPKTIIIVSSELNIPSELSDFITLLKFDLPNSIEIEQELFRLFDSLDIETNSLLIQDLVKACKGLSIERIRRVLSKILATYKTIDLDSIRLILNEKRQIISQTGILEYSSVKQTLNNIGGIQNLKNWLKKRRSAFSSKAIDYGLPSPRGLLLVGVQGTGKSLTAKVIANDWQLPLLRLDIGRLFGGIVGESELRLRQTIEVAEALAPCVLWIDEIDKAFSNTDSKGDSGTSNRVSGSFTSWLSEKNSSVFVVATANNIKQLPLEMIRKGRFDEIFFLDLPTYKERIEIFEIHLKEFRPLNWETYDCSRLATLSIRFSGAEIKQSIIDAMYYAFYEKREFTTEDIQKALTEVIPLSQLDDLKVQEIQNWALSGRIRLASEK